MNWFILRCTLERILSRDKGFVVWVGCEARVSEREYILFTSRYPVVAILKGCYDPSTYYGI